MTIKNTGMENTLYVDLDWESTGLWVPRIYEKGSEHLAAGSEYLVNANYETFNLPKDLVKRFHYWERWFSDRRPEESDEKQKMDWNLFHSYGRTLAIDLKRFLGDKHRVIYGYPLYIDGNMNYDDCEEILLAIREQVNKEEGRIIPMSVPYKK